MNDLKRIVTHTARIAHAVLGRVHELPRDGATPAPASGATAAVEGETPQPVKESRE